ncbi:MAG: helix-turn-helix domain-containing protein [Rhodocyclaceae bacterium]|nr:helix-turn-helix domain-containing protein [Rhodocyclaceae bacterium]
MKILKTLKREMLTDPATRAAYDAMTDEFAIARELIAARIRAGLSQSEVAQRMGTSQSVIARLESGKRPPSLRTVERYAQAVGGRVIVRIVRCTKSGRNHDLPADRNLLI